MTLYPGYQCLNCSELFTTVEEFGRHNCVSQKADPTLRDLEALLSGIAEQVDDLRAMLMRAGLGEASQVTDRIVPTPKELSLDDYWQRIQQELPKVEP